MSVLIPGVILAFAAVFFVLHPIVTRREAPMDIVEEELTEAEHRRDVALLALRDVEYDFLAGKLDEADYLKLKQDLSSEALSAIDAEEEEWRSGRGTDGTAPGVSGLTAQVEAEIAALRASIREGAVCSHCGHPNPSGSRFCGDCGAALPRRSAAGGSA